MVAQNAVTVKEKLINVQIEYFIIMQKFNLQFFLFQAVDVIGKAGTPKTIAGSHTHTTPVLLSFGERAELATDEYIPLSPVMEGFVILKKNEDSVMASVQ